MSAELSQSPRTPGDSTLRPSGPAPLRAAQIDEAARRIADVVAVTPLEHSDRLSAITGAQVYLKREDLQSVRSYKLRGAYNLLMQLTDEELRAGVVCSSAGNHAQGFAVACRHMKVHGRVYVPAKTPRQKRDRISYHGGEFIELIVGGASYDEAAAAAAATMLGIKAGDPTAPGTICGPVISARQRDRIQSYLDLAVAEGGTFACGGRRPPERDRGFFIEPTVVVGLTNDARVAREEIFGPVLTVIAHDGDQDAVRIANDSPYGLSGTVFSADPERAQRVASQLRVGTVNVNGGVWYSADVPFGGYKQSGIGREMGIAGFEEYLQLKAIATAV